MANTLSPHGFKPMMLGNASALSAAVNPYLIASASAVIYQYDLVKLTTNGVILQAAATDTPVGIFMGCQYTNSSGVVVKSPYWPASAALLSATTVEAYVADDPNLIFEAQFGHATNTEAQTAVGALFDITVGTGSTATGLSGASVDNSTAAGFTTAKVLRFMRFSPRPDNDPASANAYGLFGFATHQFKVVTGI